MKRQKKLGILTAVLILCIAAAVALSRMDFEEKMTGTQTTIIDVDSSEITALSWKYEEEVSFRYEDEEWINTEDEEMPVNQELLGEIAENLSNITSDKRVEEADSLSMYGLSEPAYTITIEADKTYELSIGDETFTDGEIYLSAGDEYVYLTDAGLVDEISYNLYDLVQEEEIPEMESISSISIDKTSAAELVYKENSGYCYSDAYTYYLKDGETYQNLDNDNAKAAFDTLTGFSWEECVDYYADDGELKTYGLDEPDAAVTVSYTEEEGETQEFAYEVAAAEESYYARIRDSRMVYRISQEVYDTAVQASYEELKPDEVILLDWDTVDSVDLELDGSLYTIEVESRGDDDYDYTFQGEDIAFGDVLSELSSITSSEDLEEQPKLGDNKEELVLTFHRNTEEYAEVELIFYQYDGSCCIPVLDQVQLDAVGRSEVVSLKEAINSVILDSEKEE